MAHFRAVIKGQRGEASRLGSKKTGMFAKLQSWGWDVEISAEYLEGSDTDSAGITLVNHSTGERRHVGVVDLTTGQFFPYDVPAVAAV